MRSLASYQDAVHPGMYDDGKEAEVIEDAVGYYMQLCVNHNVNISETLTKLDFHRHSLAEPDELAKAEFIRLHEEKVNQLQIITGKEFDYENLPANSMELFDVLFDKDTELTDYNELVKDRMFDDEN